MPQLEVFPLYSGSSGNATLVKADGINILIDAGVSCKRLCEGLVSIDVDPDSIDYIFITHCHSDHIAGVDVFERHHPAPLYTTADTCYVIESACRKKFGSEMIEIGQKDCVTLSDTVKVMSCPTPHDAAGSVCYKVIVGDKSFLLLTDVGHLTEEIVDFAYGVDGALVESNYDVRMLIYGFYPDELKARVAGDGGHLSNEECADLIKVMIEHGTEQFIIGHLSDKNNTPKQAVSTIVDILAKSDLVRNRDYRLSVAERYEPTDGMIL